MTVFGALAAGDCAAVWADTLLSRPQSGPSGFTSKLAINAVAGVIGTGAGWKSLGDEGDRAILRGTSLDAIVPDMADTLRRASMRIVPRRRAPERFSFSGNVLAVAGWSAAFGRMAVWELHASEFFEPRLVSAALYPVVPLPVRLGIRPSPETIVGIAARQAAELRRCGGEVGRLSIATITAAGIMLLPPRDIPEIPPGSVSGHSPAAAQLTEQMEGACE